MKRVCVLIQMKKHPETILNGYAVFTELGEQRMAFFTTEKLPPEEALQISYSLHGIEITYQAVMTQLHEQISSGRIMSGIPTEENPFPARKFYRCFAKILSKSSSQPVSTDITPLNPVTSLDAIASTLANAGEIPPVEISVNPAGEVPAAPPVEELKAA